MCFCLVTNKLPFYTATMNNRFVSFQFGYMCLPREIFRASSDWRMFLTLLPPFIISAFIVHKRGRHCRMMKRMGELPEDARKRMMELKEEMHKIRADHNLPPFRFHGTHFPLRLPLKLTFISALPGLVMTYATLNIRGAVVLVWLACNLISNFAMCLVAHLLMGGCNRGKAECATRPCCCQSTSAAPAEHHE